VTFSKTTIRALRILVAAVLVGMLIYAVDWRAVPGYVAKMDGYWAALALIGLSSHFVISPWKWQWALRIHGLTFDLPYLIRANGIGFFFNNFLPSGIGGDAYRIMSTWPKDGVRSRAVSAVVVERITGLIALIALGNLGALLLFNESQLARAFLGVSVMSAGVGVAVLVALATGGLSWLARRARTSSVLQPLTHNLGLLRSAGPQWIPLVAISVLFQAIALLYIYALFQSLGSPVPIAACALIAAVAGLATILPISINGIGVVEGSFAGAAVALGVDYEVALMVAVLIRLIVLPLSLIFGAVYALGGSGTVAAGLTDRDHQTQPARPGR
jgi:glycosyltransferase 2 family protein